MSNVEILASYWTLAHGGQPHTDHEFSTVPFEQRVAAAAKAGFTGMGIWHADLEHTLKRLSLQQMKQVLDQHGIKHVELEFLHDWFTDGERKRQSDVRRDMLLRAAAVLNARHIKVGDFDNTPCSMPKLIESFAALCAEAQRYDTRIAFELMPFANVKTLADTLTMVTGAGAKNGGFILDLWHVVKLEIPYPIVAQSVSPHLFGIEINDGFIRGPAGMTLLEETINHRQLCGEGQFDVKGFVATMLDVGYQGPWGVEVLNQGLRQLPVTEMARRAFSTTRAQFDA